MPRNKVPKDVDFECEERDRGVNSVHLPTRIHNPGPNTNPQPRNITKKNTPLTPLPRVPTGPLGRNVPPESELSDKALFD